MTRKKVKNGSAAKGLALFSVKEIVKNREHIIQFLSYVSLPTAVYIYTYP